MRRRIVECVANFSEGRNPSVVEAVAAAIETGPGVAVLHTTQDPDHNRSVITFAGVPDSVSAAAVRSVSRAVELIDLRRHRGVHPRLGAADVIPFVPIEGVTLADCADLARRTGEEIWRACGVPVYFYEAAANRPDRVRLENVRQGQFEKVRDEVRMNPDRWPDVGGPDLHPTAGAVIVGARKFLIAWNVNLATADAAPARAIARKIRASAGGFPSLKALGLALESRGQSQVSMNLTDHEKTPMHAVFEAIRLEAAALGTRIVGTEIIGLIPRSALEVAAAHYMEFVNFRPDIVLERRIEDLLPPGIERVLDQISGDRAAALACAAAAAVAVQVCGAPGQTSEFEKYRTYFAESLTAKSPDLAEKTRDLEADLRRLQAACPEPHRADLELAAALTAVARRRIDGQRPDR